MFGQFISVMNRKQPWNPYRVWVADHWLDREQSHEQEAKQIVESGWMETSLKFNGQK